MGRPSVRVSCWAADLVGREGRVVRRVGATASACGCASRGEAAAGAESYAERGTRAGGRSAVDEARGSDWDDADLAETCRCARRIRRRVSSLAACRSRARRDRARCRAIAVLALVGACPRASTRHCCRRLGGADRAGHRSNGLGVLQGRRTQASRRRFLNTHLAFACGIVAEIRTRRERPRHRCGEPREDRRRHRRP